jgi:predicted nucleotidyltransferase
MNKLQRSILEKLNGKHVVELMKNLNINNLLVFGSLLTDEFNEFSDIDVAVLGEEKLELDDILNIELTLEKILGRNIDLVDLRDLNIDIFIKITILNTAKTAYTTDNGDSLDFFIDEVDRYYRENEDFFYYRRMDLLW